MAVIKFRGINRADAFDELAHANNVPSGLRHVVHTAIDQLPDSELDVEISFDMNDSCVTALAVVKVIGMARSLPMTYTRDQIFEQRNKMGTILKG